MQRCRVPSKVAVATSVFIVSVSALAAAVSHFARFVQSGGEVMSTVPSLIIFTVPGVVLGGQLGASVATRISQRALERALGVLFVLIAILTLGEVLL